MPGFDVTVSATFKKTGDLADVESAKNRIEAALFKLAQDSTFSQDEVIAWLVDQINALIASTGASVTASDIVISNFSAAINGTESDTSGTDGGFTFAVKISKGSVSLTTNELNGTISAAPYVYMMVGLEFADNQYIYLTNIGNVPTGELTVSLAGDYAEDFILSTVHPGSLELNAETSVTIMPVEGLAASDYTLTALVESADMETVTMTFTVQVINTAVSDISDKEIKVWSSKGILNIVSSSNGKANIYCLNGTWIRTVSYYTQETIQTHLKQGIYIIITEENTYKIAVF